MQDACAHRSTAILAEDDEMVRELVALYLERLGYDVLEAKNGQEAINLLENEGQNAVSLIVTDLVMPEVGGAELVKTARQNGKCDRILIMSGFTDEIAFLEQTIRDGSEFLTKPFTYHDFESKISRLNHPSA